MHLISSSDFEAAVNGTKSLCYVFFFLLLVSVLKKM